MQIAIDTSTDTASLAITQDNEVQVELTWHCEQNHTVQLLTNLSYLLKITDLSLKSVDCIIVTRGPGSYNGLRVGISTAKGLAFSLGIPLIGISTLEAEAYQHAETGLPVCPIFNVGREEIATATYQKKSGHWRQLTAEQLTTLEVLCSQIVTRTIFCGEYMTTISTELKKQLKQKAVVLPPAAGLRRSSFLAELGIRRFQAGDFDNPTTLQPLYFRGPSITQPRPGKK